MWDRPKKVVIEIKKRMPGQRSKLELQFAILSSFVFNENLKTKNVYKFEHFLLEFLVLSKQYYNIIIFIFLVCKTTIYL